MTIATFGDELTTSVRRTRRTRRTRRSGRYSANQRNSTTQTGVHDAESRRRPRTRRARRRPRTGVLDDVKDASPRSRRGAAIAFATGCSHPVVGQLALHCTWRMSRLCNASITARIKAGETRSLVRAAVVTGVAFGCSTKASLAAAALRCERFAHAGRRRNSRWCSSLLRVVTS